MKKIFLAVAIIGMTGFAFGQQTTSNASKDTKTCTKSCNNKSCNKGTCVKGSKSCSATTSATTNSSDKK